jgi:hypothetical protein
MLLSAIEPRCQVYRHLINYQISRFHIYYVRVVLQAYSICLHISPNILFIYSNLLYKTNMKTLQKGAKELWINVEINKYSYQNLGQHSFDTLIECKHRLPN